MIHHCRYYSKHNFDSHVLHINYIRNRKRHIKTSIFKKNIMSTANCYIKMTGKKIGDGNPNFYNILVS